MEFWNSQFEINFVLYKISIAMKLCFIPPLIENLTAKIFIHVQLW